MKKCRCPLEKFSTKWNQHIHFIPLFQFSFPLFRFCRLLFSVHKLLTHSFSHQMRDRWTRRDTTSCHPCSGEMFLLFFLCPVRAVRSSIFGFGWSMFVRLLALTGFCRVCVTIISEQRPFIFSFLSISIRVHALTQTQIDDWQQCLWARDELGDSRWFP